MYLSSTIEHMWYPYLLSSHSPEAAVKAALWPIPSHSVGGKKSSLHSFYICHRSLSKETNEPKMNWGSEENYNA